MFYARIINEMKAVKKFFLESGEDFCHPCQQLKDELMAMVYRNYRIIIGCLYAILAIILIACLYRMDANWKPSKKTDTSSLTRNVKPLEKTSETTQTEQASSLPLLDEPIPVTSIKETLPLQPIKEEPPKLEGKIGMKFTRKMIGKRVRIQYAASESTPKLAATIIDVLGRTSIRVQYVHDKFIEVVDTLEHRIKLVGKDDSNRESKTM